MSTNKIGTLVVVTGMSGAGQDSVKDGLLNDPRIQKLNFKKVITCADRSPRPNEVDGVDYHFITHQDFVEMEKKGKLVEPITQFGTTCKATPTSEIERLFSGENLVWRIDLSRATDIAKGDFFKNKFSKRYKEIEKNTIVLFVTAPQSVIDERRKKRDGERYDAKEYEARDNSIRGYSEILNKIATPIENLDGKLDDAVDKAVVAVLDLNNNISNE